MLKPERDLGSLGELELQRWCNQVGIVANKSDVDKTGWDFILELPEKDEIIIPLDENPSTLRCMIQVKSTDKPKGNREVNLKNWNLLVKNPLPTFFLALEFDGKNDCQRAYLVHIDESYIRKTLKRLRKLSETPDVQLHKRYMSFNYDESKELPSLSGKCLLEKIRNSIGELDTYIKQKIELCENIGFENGNSAYTFEVLIPEQFRKEEYAQDPKEFLVDFVLGLVPHVEVNETKVYGKRFDVVSSEPQKVTSGGRLELRPAEQGKATLTFKVPESGGFTKIEEIYRTPHGVSHLLGEYSEEYLKVLVEAPFMRNILWAHRKQNDLQISNPEPTKIYNLADLRDYANVVLLAGSTQPKGEVLLEVALDSELFAHGSFSLNFAQDDVKKARWIRDAQKVASHFGVLDGISLRLIDLETQKKPLEVLAGLLTSEEMISRLVWSGQALEHKVQCLPYIFELVLGQYRFVSGIAIAGKPVFLEAGADGQKKFQIENGDLRLTHTYHVKLDESLPYTLDEIKQSVVAECQKQIGIFELE